jgi:hypothetical protein
MQGVYRLIERRHGKPLKFLFLLKMGLLGSQASTNPLLLSSAFSTFHRKKIVRIGCILLIEKKI